MKTEVIKFDLANELDIVLAHKRASQLCDLTKISISGRTSFVTAISEICRNCLEYVGSGKISFSVYNDASKIEATIIDKGPGIKNLDVIMNQHLLPGTKGCGLQNSRKLVDYFDIQSTSKGTTVTLGMRILSKSVPINITIIKGWAQYFEKELPVSPYEEIKQQNMQLLELTEQLSSKNLQSEEQIEEIKQLNHQLSLKNKELEDFAYTISHDLKTPLANLKLLASIIETSNNIEQKEKYIKEFKKLTSRLDEMLNGLVEIIDLKNHQNNIAKVASFEDILNVVLEEQKQQLVENHASYKRDFTAAPTIFYYEVYLHSILSNLISNAIKYHGEAPPYIDVASWREGEYVVLQVIDNGIGMDMNKIKKNMFKPFKRFSNKVEGKGIGLHLVKSMVERNGGRIEVYSEIDKGTTFKLYLREYSL